MKHYKLFFITVVLLIFAGCKKFSTLASDPNRTTTATPALLLTYIEEHTFNQVSSGSAEASRMLVNTLDLTDEFYSWQRGSFTDYDYMSQVMDMENAAKNDGEKQYLALADFFNSFFIIDLTQQFGDVPYLAALQAGQGNSKPKYDTQEAIYEKVLSDLSAANQILINNPGTFGGDIVYQGNTMEWRKLINSFELRVLISLSHKTGDANLNVEQHFKTIMNNPQTYPIMTSNSDNAELTFYDKDGNRYPLYEDNGTQSNVYMEKTFVDKLKNLKDPRLFSFAAQEPNYSSAPADSFGAYDGVLGSATLNEMVNASDSGRVSRINPRFYNNPTNEPSIALSYAETEFNIAEAIERGWISGNMNTYYQNGITASMKFYGISDSQINQYIQSDSVAIAGNNALHQILWQKYIAFYMNSGWEPFYNQRRTGYPVFDISGGGAADNQVPKRWMYPESEFQNNASNVQAAISRQFPSLGDNINATMWLLKNQ